MIPSIDIGAFGRGNAEVDRHIAGSLDAACRDLGFMVVSGHGVPPETIAAVHHQADRFFALPMAAKLRVRVGTLAPYSGYERRVRLASTTDRAGTEAPAASAHDLKENYGMGPVDWDPADPYFAEAEAGGFFAPNPWPPELPDLKPAFMTGYREMSALAGRLMRVAALSFDLDPDFFEDKIDRHTSHLFVQRYPPQVAPPEPGQLRAGAHTDFGSLTILHLGHNADQGLQVRNREGRWQDIGAPDDAFVVNVGDLLARWTNDEWNSTLHRVANPPPSRAARHRQSITFFHQPNYDAVISCLPSLIAAGRTPRYAPISSGRHYAHKVAVMRGEA